MTGKTKWWVFVLVATAMSFSLGRAFAAAAEKPNFMIIIGDDMTWHDCEPYGNAVIHTPNLQRLADEGMCFDAMFTATAMCAPTRQQLYTGLHPVRNGAYPNHSRVREGTKSIVHHLESLGYRVALMGKTHYKPPESFPFEYLGDIRQGKIDEAKLAEFINRDPDQPYCVVVASHEPHSPWNIGDPSQYDPADFVVPPYLYDCPETREAMRAYYAEITALDDEVGVCLNLIDRSAQAKNTLVMFLSEQGSSMPFGKWTCYDAGQKAACIVRWPGKVKPGTRTSALCEYIDVVPTFLEAAGADPSRFDTGCPDAFGNRGFDGKSFLDVLLGRKDTHREYVYGAHTTRGIINGSACYPIRSVRNERFKYIWNPNWQATFYNTEGTQPNGLPKLWLKRSEAEAKARAEAYYHRPEEELYDLQADPFELHNLANDPQYAPVKKKLRQVLDAWMKQQGDEGIGTEMKALERQGMSGNKTWQPYDPDHPPVKKAKQKPKQAKGK